MGGTFKLLLLLSAVVAVSAIYNGTDDGDAEDYKFMAIVRSRNESDFSVFCGGVIINANTVLTAASCVIDNTNIDVTVGNGDQLWDYGENARNYSARQVIVHEGYTGNSYNDIALLRLSEPIVFVDNVIEAIDLALADTEDEYLYDVGSTVTMMGFGETQSSTPLSSQLFLMTQEVAHDDNCEANYWQSPDLYYRDGHFCAAVSEDRMERPMTGDQGGPVFTKRTTNGVASYILVGVMSDYDYGKEGEDVHVNVMDLVASGWLENNMQRDSDYSFEFRSNDDDETKGVIILMQDDNKLGYMCNDGVGRNEVDAICRDMGFETGTVVDPYTGTDNGQYDLTSEFKYVGADFYCPEGADINQCFWKDYDRVAVPCWDGMQLAVSCSDEDLSLEVDWFFISESNKKTKFSIAAEVVRYGFEAVDLDNNAEVLILNVDEDSEIRQISVDWKYKSQSNYWTGKVSEIIEDSCYVGVVCILDTTMFTIMIDGNCSIEDRDSVEEQVNEYMQDKMSS